MTLPTKPDSTQRPDVGSVPTWRELGDRFRDLLKDFLAEGKEIEREIEPRLIPALNRLKLEIETLIARLEERAKRKG
jgi:hypothetical protein